MKLAQQAEALKAQFPDINLDTELQNPQFLRLTAPDIGMSVEDVTVSAGDFEDTAIVLMNEGNMGISTFDIEMFTREGGRVDVVETLHCDCLHPENSSLTMHGEGHSATLPEGEWTLLLGESMETVPSRSVLIVKR